MKLIKLPQDHYIIVNDSQIKEGDYVLSKLNEVEVFGRRYTPSLYRKITHSTQPLEYSSKIGKYWGKVMPLTLTISEIKELIGEVDVEKKAINSWEGCDGCDANDELFFINGYQKGYNQAIEDNKDKKYTEKDLWKAMGFGYDMCRQKRLENGGFENFIKSLQSKTEWEVEFIDGNLILV